jgi:hypothetical protein
MLFSSFISCKELIITKKRLCNHTRVFIKELRSICQVSSNYTAIGMCGRKVLKFSSGSSYKNTKSSGVSGLMCIGVGGES